jgi:FHA domain-containing protein
MTLTLRAVSLNDLPLTQPITAHFNARGGSVGRGDHNTLALPDPERFISRQQAEICVSGVGYAIRNVGSSNPIIVRGQALARGESAPLAHRDQVRIGGYLLEVIQETAHDEEAATVVRGRAAVDASAFDTPRRAAAPSGVGRSSAGSTTGGFSDLGAPLSRSNPFADLLGDAKPSPQPLLPEDFDPFAPLSPAPTPAPAPVPPTPPLSDSIARGPFDDLIPNAAPSSIDILFGLNDGAADPLAAFLEKPVAPQDGAPPDGMRRAPPSCDPMAMFDDLPLPGVDCTPQPADHVPELHAAFVPPAVSIPPVLPPQPQATAEPFDVAPSKPRAAPQADAQDAWQGAPHELWAAFCEGADITLEPKQGIDPDLMRVIGSLLRASVAGTLQLMSVRASAKHELRANVTMIQARNNNPLKFSPDARAALEQMLQPPMRGFLPGPAAMTDAMHDLVGHTIGTMVGTRAALEGVLDRFAPKQLEAKLNVHSLLDSLLPMNRKAKLWMLYLQHFESIRNEAQEDFHSLFGRAFLAAYQQQLERLKRDEPAKT